MNKPRGNHNTRKSDRWFLNLPHFDDITTAAIQHPVYSEGLNILIVHAKLSLKKSVSGNNNSHHSEECTLSNFTINDPELYQGIYDVWDHLQMCSFLHRKHKEDTCALQRNHGGRHFYDKTCTEIPDPRFQSEQQNNAVKEKRPQNLWGHSNTQNQTRNELQKLTTGC